MERGGGGGRRRGRKRGAEGRGGGRRISVEETISKICQHSYADSPVIEHGEKEVEGNLAATLVSDRNSMLNLQVTRAVIHNDFPGHKDHRLVHGIPSDDIVQDSFYQYHC
eukprot:GHVU01181949.1.p2 GENE.GHVU01181949.1~~GHVU01181949.1.p2  ORF type:complete len:110 (-),score=18.72 GHVU01181949.1:1697-2026(-)